ncbi:MAG: hypothetical protein DMF96_23400 [Acidobacteria bacterium]|nr:MAG: hypothetical protein DMF96_23400 [Acidobacteriota bacterium]
MQREIEHLREKLAKRDRQIADLERQVALRQQREGTRRDAIVKLISSGGRSFRSSAAVRLEPDHRDAPTR